MQECSYCGGPAEYVDVAGAPVCFAHYDGPVPVPGEDQEGKADAGPMTMHFPRPDGSTQFSAGEVEKIAAAQKRMAEEINGQRERIVKLQATLYAIEVLAGSGDPAVFSAIVMLAHNFQGTAEG